MNADITPNALLSILAAVGKSSLLLPMSSAIGQMKWSYFGKRPRALIDMQRFDEASRGPIGAVSLLCTIHWKAIVASMAAVVTVLALAVDPFTQQAVSYPSVQSSDSTRRAFLGVTTALTPGFESSLDSTIFRAVTLDKSLPPYACPSNNCRWPQYRSLGLCSTCEDVSHQVQRNCTGNLCSWTLPNGLSVTDYGVRVKTWNTDTSLDAIMTGNLNTTFATLSTLSNAYTVLGTIAAPGVEVPVYAGAQANQCSVQWCVKTYSDTQVSDGLFTEPASAVVPLRVDDCNSTTGVCYGSAGDHSPGADIPKEASGDPPANVPGPFVLSVRAVYRMQQDFYSALNISDSNVGGQAGAMADILAAPMTDILDNLALSLTHWIRAGSSSTSVEGTVLVPMTYVHVTWQWIVYPASLSLFAALLLLVTILLARKSPDTVWKSSTLCASTSWAT